MNGEDEMMEKTEMKNDAAKETTKKARKTKKTRDSRMARHVRRALPVLRVFSASAILAGAMGLAGCSALNIGEEHFSCDGMPGSIYCHSARDVYEKTNDGVVPSPVGKAEGSYNPDCTDCIRAEDVNPDLRVEEDGMSQYAVTKDGRRLKVVEGRVASKTKKNAQNIEPIQNIQEIESTEDEIIRNYVSPALPDNPVPIRTPSQVMRIWIAPYVDTVGDLIAPGFVYTEVEERRWIYPSDDNKGSQRVFNPLWAGDAYRYGSPASYSNPGSRFYPANGGGSSGMKNDDKDSYNSLLKFRRDREAKMKSMAH